MKYDKEKFVMITKKEYRDLLLDAYLCAKLSQIDCYNFVVSRSKAWELLEEDDYEKKIDAEVESKIVRHK